MLIRISTTWLLCRFILSITLLPRVILQLHHLTSHKAINVWKVDSQLVQILRTSRGTHVLLLPKDVFDSSKQTTIIFGCVSDLIVYGLHRSESVITLLCDARVLCVNLHE